MLTPSITITGGPHVTDPIDRARRRPSTQLRAQGIDFVVALTHLDVADDLALVRAVPGIDLVLGGHDHNPIAVMEGDTLVFKAGSDAHWLGVVEMRVDPEAHTVVPSWRMVANHGTVPSPEVQARVETYEQALDVTLLKPLGKTKVPLDTRKHVVRSEETAFGDYVADADARAPRRRRRVHERRRHPRRPHVQGRRRAHVEGRGRASSRSRTRPCSSR